MRRIYNNTARSVYAGGDIQYFYSISIHEQTPFITFIKKLFGGRGDKHYHVVFVITRMSSHALGYETDFKRILCDSYIVGQAALAEQVEGLRIAGQGSTENKDVKYVDLLIDDAYNFVTKVIK